MARKKKKKKNLWFEPGELPKWVEEEEDNETRLGNYNNAKRSLVLDIEDIFKSGDEDTIFLKLKDSLQKIAKVYARKWNNYRLSAADSESAF